MTTPSFREIELLSAYADGTLSPSDAARLESRLASEPELRAVMDELRVARAVLRKLPARKAPRRFVLTPAMAGLRPPLPRVYPVLRFASALATILLLFTAAINLVSNPPALGFAAPAAAPFGGAGAGGAPEEEPPATMQAAEAQIEPTLETADSARVAGTATPEIMAKGFANEQPEVQPALRVPYPWQSRLLIAALVLAGAAWLVRYLNDRNWRANLQRTKR
ncbi:MAG TPA: zf-HC2 domain-containing protein [Anaerolineales bacterium]|jgi:anti-sigma factor RsiW